MSSSIPLIVTPGLQPGPLHRLPDWQERIAHLVLARIDQPWALGVRDCCLWAADAALAVTGRDPAHAIRGRYMTPQQAQRVLRDLGGLRGIGGAGFGPQIRPAAALEGDVALVRHEGKPMLAVCAAKAWLVVGTHGLRALPWGAPVIVWGVGHA